jgi:AcrR family transcriptional regulator
MPRHPKFDSNAVIDITARLAARHPAEATIARIAAELDAPTGSIYHRFRSRDELLGEVWLSAAAAFQSAFAAQMVGDNAFEAGLAAARWVPSRVRERFDEARILMLHRREDFAAPHWPAPMQARARQLSGEMLARFDALAERLGIHDDIGRQRVRFAVVELPLAVVRPHLRAGNPPPPLAEALIEDCYRAVLAPVLPSTAGSATPSDTNGSPRK